jgi:hypothetical protein
MRKIILHGRKINGGIAEGEALVTRNPLGGFGCFDFDNGNVIDINHEWYGQTVKGKVLVFTAASGSSAWTIAHQALRFAGVAPVAYLVRQNNPQTALGSVVARLPCVADLNRDPTEVILTGDWVKVDAETGRVEITRTSLNNSRSEA